MADPDGAQDAEDVRSAVDAHWGLQPVTVTPLPGGMNSRTWTVTRSGDGSTRRWVAKLVGPDERDGFRRGLAAAAVVDGAGIPAGAPEPTADGRLSAEVAGGHLALLRWVDGRPLTGATAEEQVLIGRTLAAAHRALRGADCPGTGDFPGWVDVTADHLGAEGWVRPAVHAALGEYARAAAGRLTCGLLHADPAPEAFLWSARRRRCGLIDWSSAVHGPLLYDLASAVMYVGGPGPGRRLVQSYADAGVLPHAEIADGLLALLRLRWAVQADYFARRLASGDRTGIADPAENRTGLHDARAFFAAEAPATS